MKPIAFPFEPKPLGNDLNQFEQPCGVCGEPLIFAIGDRLHIRVGDDGELTAILCTKCYDSDKKKGVGK